MAEAILFQGKLQDMRLVHIAGVLLGMTVASAGAQVAKPLAVPFTKKHIYDEQVDPHKDVAAGFAQAKREHKRVLLDFGGDWCGDCQVLDIYFHQAPNDELLAKNFVLVHVFIGHIDLNLDIPEKFGLPIKKGVPALVVADANGKPVYVQHGEFEDMRHMDAQSVTAFLERWKP